MKKLFYILAASLALAAVACNKAPNDKDEQEATLEINEANLKGTWEVDIEHDFAQGYHRKYRIAFDGKTYTLWKMYQDLLKVDGEFKLYDVGDKYKGSWTYANGSLTLTAAEWSASSRLVYDDFYTGQTHAEVNAYNVETMEASPWFELNDMASMLDPEVWTNLSLTKTQLKARINMDSVTFARKN